MSLKFLTSLTSLFEPGCAGIFNASLDRIVKEVSAPGGTLRAVMFKRTARNPDSNSVHISILPPGDGIGIAGNVCVIHGRAKEVSIAWYGDRVLIVSTPPQAQFDSRHEQVAGVTISYSRE